MGQMTVPFRQNLRCFLPPSADVPVPRYCKEWVYDVCRATACSRSAAAPLRASCGRVDDHTYLSRIIFAKQTATSCGSSRGRQARM